jgi:hypothetical protein
LHSSLEIEDFIFIFAFIVHSSFKSIEGEGRANVLDKAREGEIPPAALVVLFLEAFPLFQIVRKGFEWVNESSKWSYKIGECNETYVTK